MWFEVGMTERISYVRLDYYVVGLEGGTNWEISLEQWEVLIWIIIRFIGQLFAAFLISNCNNQCNGVLASEIFLTFNISQ